MKWACHKACIDDTTNIENLVWKREVKLRRCSWQDNIELDM